MCHSETRTACSFRPPRQCHTADLVNHPPKVERRLDLAFVSDDPHGITVAFRSHVRTRGRKADQEQSQAAIPRLGLRARWGSNRRQGREVNPLLEYLQEMFIRVRTQEEGQALVEYALILALISVVAIGALTAIGVNVLAILTSVAAAL